MDFSGFFRSSESSSSPSSSKENPRSVLYKSRPSRVRRDKSALREERKNQRRQNMDRRRHIQDSIIPEEGEAEEEEGASEVPQEAPPLPPRLSRRKEKGSLQEEQTRILSRLADFRLRKKHQREKEAKSKKPVFKVGCVHHKPYPFEVPKASSAPKGSHSKGNEVPSCSQKENKALTQNTLHMKEEPKAASLLPPLPLKTTLQEGNCPSPSSPQAPSAAAQTESSSLSPTQQEEEPPASPPKKDEDKTTLGEGPSALETDDDIIFKTPLQPRSRSRRRSKVSPLLDGLRKDICFNRGNFSDQRRAKKGLPLKMTSPLESIVRELENKEEETQPPLLTQKVLFDEDETPQDADETTTKDLSLFRGLYDESVKRLSSSADAWEVEEMESVPPTEELQGRVSAAVGKARLLMGPKGRLEQFKSLMDNCEFKRGEKETKADDLQGFWDMISYQIQGIYKEFEDLRALQASGWANTEKKPKEDEVKRRPKAKASRKADANEEQEQENEPVEEKSSNEPMKNFDGGFFRVSSPLKASPSLPSPKQDPPSTPSRKLSTPDNLRRSLLVNSVIRVSSSARRSLACSPEPHTPGRARRSLRPEVNLISFDSPELSTPRRSKRLSCKMTPLSYRE
ncbi:Putative guanylate-kinase-associated protein [Caligus rogercresseyi]|uniref:Guanylate-kinase-associated protein n=1 Tax=Caligus rogercresseyi TaxID=217165 RepID=A0A7T8KGR5_CALRO|nr:Putative guanylate-kinase-associated protein [Caligus rogercresseyi]